MPLSVVVQIAVSGALMGLVYALIAYGFQLTYATSKSLNFAQGELVMVSAFVSLTLLNTGLPYVVMVPLGILFGALLGVVIERVAVRLALQQKNEGWILNTIIVGLFLVSFAENVWGRDDRPFPTPIPADPINILGVEVTWLEISVAIGVSIMSMVGVRRRTCSARPSSRVGPRRGRAHGHLGHPHGDAVVCPVEGGGRGRRHPGLADHRGPTMAAALVLEAFSVAVVAGLESSFGVVLVPRARGARARQPLHRQRLAWPASSLILALAVRPTGLFGKGDHPESEEGAVLKRLILVRTAEIAH
jgi:branched-chain amino acid transport system permease protein